MHTDAKGKFIFFLQIIRICARARTRIIRKKAPLFRSSDRSIESPRFRIISNACTPERELSHSRQHNNLGELEFSNAPINFESETSRPGSNYTVRVHIGEFAKSPGEGGAFQVSYFEIWGENEGTYRFKITCGFFKVWVRFASSI